MSIAFVEATRGRVIAVSYRAEDAHLMVRHLAPYGRKDMVDVVRADATTPFLRGSSVDQVLLIDVLEHLMDESGALRSIHHCLRPGGFLLLSVPTHRYPEVFGVAFDREIGHVRHYSSGELLHTLESSGFQVVRWEYHTKRWASALCHISYVKLQALGPWGKGLNIVLAPVLVFASALDAVTHRTDARSSRWASGIAALAIKPLREP